MTRFRGFSFVVRLCGIQRVVASLASSGDPFRIHGSWTIAAAEKSMIGLTVVARSSSIVDGDRRLAARRHHVHVLLVEAIQDPNILSGHATRKRARRSKARLAIRDSGKAICFRELSDGRKHCPIRRRPLGDSERGQGSTKCGAQPRDSSGQGDSPFAMQRSSCSALSSMKSPCSKSSVALRNSSSRSDEIALGGELIPRAAALVPGLLGVPTIGECHFSAGLSQNQPEKAKA